jgi:hypothetical protein
MLYVFPICPMSVTRNFISFPLTYYVKTLILGFNLNIYLLESNIN